MADTVIIGGGATGLALAYHLGRKGTSRVTLLERNRLTSGTTWHAAGIVGPLRATLNMTKLAMQALELFPRLETEAELSIGYRTTGGYWLARRRERLDELRRIGAVGGLMGLGVSHLTGEAFGAACPWASGKGICGALRVAEDGQVNPVDLCMAYAKLARENGVVISENTPVDSILVDGGRVAGVRLEGGAEVRADRVALCAGAWSKSLADKIGVALPLQPVEHMYVVTEPIADLPDPFPVIRDLDRGCYVKGDAGKLLIGAFERNAKCWNPCGQEGNRPFLELAEDWDQLAPFLESAIDLLPQLETAGIVHFMNGPESFTADTKPLVGETPEVDGLFVAAGMNSVGVMSSAGIGSALADWMADGKPPFDLWEIDIARVDALAAGEDHLRARMAEAVSDQFALHWPYRQPTAGRGLRKSPLHDRWRRLGAAFGVTAGWERALWYAKNNSERDLPYSVGIQAWQPIAEREAEAMSDSVALIDLSPFTKIDISGDDALQFLQHIASGNMDIPIGRAVYTTFLNEGGGIEADATVSRISEFRYRITSGAAARRKDLARLRRSRRGFSVSISDKTETEAVIGVMGPKANQLLSSCSQNVWTGFPYGTVQAAEISGVPVAAMRISFVGEAGWEIAVTAEHSGAVFDALCQPGVTPLGHYALDGCRMEKGFRHWGHDLGPDLSPLESGLSFTVDWAKPDFVGKEALFAQKAEGVRRRLTLFEVHGSPLLLHDEPILEGAAVIGLTTSGAVGPRTGKRLAFGIIPIAAGETLEQTPDRSFQVIVAGALHQAAALAEAPYDPDGERMRS